MARPPRAAASCVTAASSSTLVLWCATLALAAGVGRAAPWGACAASPSYADPEPPVNARLPVWPGPPPPGAAVPTPRAPLVWSPSTDRVSIPTQPIPSDAELAQRYDCPHAQAGVRPWHDPATWPDGVVPEGGNVTIPVGAPVLLASCSLAPGGVFGIITVPVNATLVFADADVTLQAHAVVVTGALRAGADTCRLRSAVNITLHGARPGPSPALRIDGQAPWVKSVLAMGRGTLDLHGVRYAPTWTRLAATARRGDTWVFLQDAVNWEAGQTVIVVTTALKEARDYTETEERVVGRVYRLPSSGNVTAVELTAPLAYDHYGGGEYQAEVGLLSRRVSVQGSALDSRPTDAQPAGMRCSNSRFASWPCGNTSLTGYGACVMVMGSAGAAGRVSGVLLRDVGQTNAMGFYPMHWHFLNNSGASSYFQDSAVWRSYFRVISVHASHGGRVSNNVGHDVIAHG